MPRHNFLTDRDPKAQLYFSGRVRPATLRRPRAGFDWARFGALLFSSGLAAGTCYVGAAIVNGLLAWLGLAGAPPALVWLFTGGSAVAGFIMPAVLMAAGDYDERQ